ncbi:MAG: hypothetical protein ACJAVV_003106 [Alphaproteobacteria bacterium]|jgi:hypothetical protein
MKNNGTSSDCDAETKIWKWLDAVVIGENLCPFAKVPRENKQVRLLVVEETAVAQILTILANECLFLSSNPKTETSLIALSKGLTDFYDYLDTLDMAQQLLEELDYEGVFQLASFHPAYLFEGEPADSVSHYTNRAPFPMFHLIREASITKALTFVDDPDAIPERNIAHANKLGVAFFKSFL